MPDSLYQVGDPVPLRAEFRDAAGDLTDTSVTLEVVKPDGTQLTPPAVVHASVGVYTATVPAADATGVWFASFIGTGAVSAVERHSWVVQSRFTQTAGFPLSPRALVSLADAREYVLGNVLDGSQDDKLVRRINSMSEAVYSYTNREWFPVAAATRKFYCNGRMRLINFREFDLVAPTMITAFTDNPATSQIVLTPPSSTVTGDYRLGPVGGMSPAGTFKWLELSEYWIGVWPLAFRGFEVTVTGTWGIGVVPADVREATLIAVENSFENPQRASTRTVGPLTYSEPIETYETTGDAPWRALPAESRALLAEYRDDPTPLLV